MSAADIRAKLLTKQSSQIVELNHKRLGTLWFRYQTNAERVQKYDLWLWDADGKERKGRKKILREHCIVATCVDKDGNDVFTDEDIPALQELPAVEITELVDIASTCLGLNSDDIADKVKKKSSDSEQTAE